MIDKKFLNSAVLVSLIKEEDGYFTLSLDDMLSQDKEAKIWKRDFHFTVKKCSEENIKNLDLSDKELADFGFSILTRLKVLNKIKG